MEAPRDTIFAQITPPGVSAIAVIRISGNNTFAILKKLTGIENFEHQKLYVRTLKNKNNIIDKAIISIFKSPHSYTGEDMAEISVHGGYASIRKLKNILFELGLREAKNGEFTRRAFYNNKMDLIQAESILSIIEAKTSKILEKSIEKNNGVFSKYIYTLKEKIIDLISVLDSSIDFPDDVDYKPSEIESQLNNIMQTINEISNKSENSILFSRGIKILITGRTNTGKSTLFNRLVKEDRAIITEEEGTTRDIISEWIKIDNIPALLMDSAGIRETTHQAEKIGIEKVLNTYEKVDLIIFIFDLSKGFTEEDKKLYENIKNYTHIILGNKKDISNKDYNLDYMSISALKDSDLIDKINSIILKKLNINDKNIDYILNERELNIVLQMKSIISSIDKNVLINNPEIISEKLKFIKEKIGELTGEITNEDILDNIFKNFCIGK